MRRAAPEKPRAARAARAAMNDKPERTPLWFIHICGHRCGNTNV